MFYPIVLHKEADSDYGVTIPDLPGCFSAGATVDEAIVMAQEAIELHLEGMIEEGEVLPRPSTLERLQGQSEFAGGSWALVPIVLFLAVWQCVLNWAAFSSQYTLFHLREALS